ncbi:MAG: CocE/NonD family hydrolase [Planctomycetes bacterium]|nr:CocE/NonD family hydrolase [Planctomycetota bacterium]
MSTAGALGVIEEYNVRVPMRDGVTLSTNIFRPDAPGKFPALLMRTPYGKGQARHDRFVRAGYVVATQDSRGRYESDGKYTMFSVENTGDAEDGYDAVEWLAKQPWCDGKVGTFGASYCAWMQWMLARLRPPHLKAMSAVSIPTTLPDVDFTGSFRPARRIHWWMNSIAPDVKRRENGPPPHDKAEAGKIWNDIDRAKWLYFLPYAKLPRELFGSLAGPVFEWMKKPWVDPWKFQEHHKDVTVPNLDFTGWYDHCWSMDHHVNMRKNGGSKLARDQQKIVVGPWNHTGIGQRKIGEIDFGPDAQLDKEGVQIQWFDHWLKDIDNEVEDWPPVRYFVMGENRWKTSAVWPAKGAKPRNLYLAANGMLHTKPRGDDSPDEYTYNPADPVMTLWTPSLFTVPSDRTALRYRRDILRYSTTVLEEDVEVVGAPEVVLHAASTAKDTDFFARLVDVYPDGRAIDISVGMVRARYRNGYEPEQLLTPGEVVEYRIKLRNTACRFLKGHRIQVEIASSDFPNYDRNHNTGKNDFSDPELIPAKQTIHHSMNYPSRVILPVTPG